MLKSISPLLNGRHVARSMSQIDWAAEGYEGTKLANLVHKFSSSVAESQITTPAEIAKSRAAAVDVSGSVVPNTASSAPHRPDKHGLPYQNEPKRSLVS